MRKILWPVLFLLTGCMPATRTQSVTFIDPDYRQGQYSSIVVEAQDQSLAQRQTLEYAAADALVADRVHSFSSIDLIPPTKNFSEKQRQRIALETGAQAVLVIVPTDAHVVSSRTYTGGPVYEGGVFGGSHHRGFYSGVGIGAGYPIGSPFEDYRELRAREVIYEVTLYTLPGLNAVWKGEFTSQGPYTMTDERIGQSVAGQVVKRLQLDGLI